MLATCSSSSFSPLVQCWLSHFLCLRSQSNFCSEPISLQRIKFLDCLVDTRCWSTGPGLNVSLLHDGREVLLIVNRTSRTGKPRHAVGSCGGLRKYWQSSLSSISLAKKGSGGPTMTFLVTRYKP
ncbi:uncharacterized protein LOC121937464 isoform X3 [Sceloporus undulatus]|uniref:uncharacterized protein LOC121937464 isoform X3 n=1 Tax=Sceloporus undulatus TaxID=8520 RepID=UPI001C4AF591|nr:uncharacterized protein LOC121937464 isoform X3 [Sceloporus undulatus]